MNLSAVGPWQESLVNVVVCDHAVNDSALPQFEMMQMMLSYSSKHPTRHTKCILLRLKEE